MEPPIEALLRVRSFLGSSSFRSMPGAKMEKIKDGRTKLAFFFYHFEASKKTDARANAQRLSRSAAVACFRCLFVCLLMEKVDKKDSHLPARRLPSTKRES